MIEVNLERAAPGRGGDEEECDLEFATIFCKKATAVRDCVHGAFSFDNLGEMG